MSGHQSIENALSAINETVFQELCDRFLALRNRNYSAFSRIGSQSGKQKTKPGTPDSFFLLPNGNYIYVEITTNVSDKKKLAKDIEACFDSIKSKIPIEKIEEIVLCFNFNIDQKQTEELNQLASDYKKGIRVSYWSLDALSIELHMQHRDLVHEYLKLPLDTGQVVSTEKFIAEYNRAAKGIATPLDNEFLHRESEKEEIKRALLDTDFLIVTGAPGIGKTRLAIETITDFLKENDTFGAYCISYKNHTLLDDLFQYFDSTKDYILFVDDANRIDAFSQITGFYKATRSGKLKIIITVRDYAFQEIGVLCQEYDPKRIDINKLTDEQITDIIKANPYEILNADYQKEIIRIADGNPRLAIMASLLAKEEQNLHVMRDVSSLFEKYFSTFIKDKDEFANDFNIKCLGIIGFFHTIPYKDKGLVSPILDDFDITYSDFIDAVEKLDKLELIDIQYDYIKVPEQNLSIYFFYKSFIKDELLSFQVLLNKYFDNNIGRFKECVISANNTFGSQSVMDKLQPEIQKHWNSIKSDYARSYKLLSTFWFYLQPETLAFIYDEIKSIPIDKVSDYKVSYEMNEFTYNRNQTIELLGEFFRLGLNLKDALELAFEHVARFPETLPEWIHKIRETLIFEKDDESTSFSRQTILFDLLIDGFAKGNQLYKVTFYELAKTFLSYQFQQSKGERKNSITIYNYPIPNTHLIHDFRQSIWEVIQDNFSDNPDKSIELLNSYSSPNPDVIKEIMEFDLPFVLEIIEKHLSTDSFDQCKYVQDQIRWWQRNDVSNSIFPKYQATFTNSTYEIFLKIDWDRLRDKEMYEYENYDEYNRLKEAEIRSSFVFVTQVEAKAFYDSFLYVYRETKNDWNYLRTLEIVIDENYTTNFDVGHELLKLVINDNNEICYVPRLVFRNHLRKNDNADIIWELIESKKFQYRIQWELSFFDNIDKSLITDAHPKAILKTIGEIEESVTIHFDRLDRFIKEDPDLFQKILGLIIKHNETGKIQLRIWMGFFSDHFDKLGDDIDLLKVAYLQQNLIQAHYDRGGKGFVKILERDSSFLIDYIHSLISQEGTRLAGYSRDLSLIWQINDIEEQLTQAFNMIINSEPYFGILEHFCNNFFRNIPDETKERADQFVLDYVTENFADSQKMNAVVDIARHTRKELFDDVLLHYISLNQSAEDFSKIWWRGNGGTYKGEVIIGDIEASDWKSILSIIEVSDVGAKLIPIKKHINDRMESSLRHGDWERQRRFLES
ncbi:MAG: ATP-binding protein [Bacteroidetes bacterium]|nr:ATP-binding protein [Bacteroidota bacterium]